VKNYNKIARQAGMTLIELTVVLLVLIGLAGLMIPYVGGFVDKTHDSANSDSLAAVNGAIQRYDVQYMGQPSNYDSLMDTSLTAGNLYTKMMGGLGTMGTNDYLKTVTIPGAALADAGITSLMVMNTTTADATFAATSSAAGVASGTDYKLAAINVKGSMCTMGGVDAMGCVASDAALSAILGRAVNTTNNDYVVFGIGQDSGMIGKTISEAPVHFAKTGAMSAANKYNRILAVYEIPVGNFMCVGGTQAVAGATGVPADLSACETAVALSVTAGEMTVAGVWTDMAMNRKAKFLTTLMPMMKLEGLGGALASHYSSLNGG